MSKCSEDAKGNRQGGRLWWALGGAPSCPTALCVASGHQPNRNGETWGGERLKPRGLVATEEPESQQEPEVATALFRTQLQILEDQAAAGWTCWLEAVVGLKV